MKSFLFSFRENLVKRSTKSYYGTPTMLTQRKSLQMAVLKTPCKNSCSTFSRSAWKTIFVYSQTGSHGRKTNSRIASQNTSIQTTGALIGRHFISSNTNSVLSTWTDSQIQITQRRAALIPDSTAKESKTFTSHWGDDFNWLCRPTSLIGESLKHAELCKCRGVLIVPERRS